MMEIQGKSLEQSDNESENSAPELIEDESNRLSDDEEYPISDEDEEMNEGGMKGWAGSMAKVLSSDKSGVLSKAKKVEDVAKKKEKKSYTFEIEGETKAEDDEEKPDQKALERALEKRRHRERRENKLRVFSLRLKPSVIDLDRERTFKKIATRGVVQLFNAVKNQQSEITQKLQNTKLESKREEIIRSADNKKKFLDNLMTGPRAKSEFVDNLIKNEKKEETSSDEEEENEKESNWSALRNDFMTGKKIGWDKDDESDDEVSNEMETDSD
ncbi:CLUMA_CG004324, isoform A [Clunio marinus]|uniref:RRP15-like protein n=1 Tax=Clunio marinus TaxID=568069 RepID=A0A1J1HVT6_9DIPT|nr:CLUMA_CG004324, isoform A [Clunio marinus]